MNLPGFNADNSLPDSGSAYRLQASATGRAEVIPQFCFRQGLNICCCYFSFCHCFRVGVLQ